MTQAVLVNGVPASGKSTIARAIGSHLQLPVLSLDAVKEAIYDELGNAGGDREYGRALSRASMQAIWSLIAGFPAGSTVVVEAWFRLPPHDVVLRGLERAGIDRWVEVWCHAPADVLMERYATRARNPLHPGPGYAIELGQLAAIARPMALAPTLEVDTSDMSSPGPDAIAGWVQEHLRPGGHHRVGQG
jgi:glucokinase